MGRNRENPCDQAKSGWKRSVATDRNGSPVGWATDGANRHDSILFAPTLESMADRGFLSGRRDLPLDRGYGNNRISQLCESVGLTDVICARKPPGDTVS